MKDKLQALITEQKALIVKFEELLNSTTEESSTLDPKKVYIKGHPTRGAEVIKMLEDLGGVNRAKVEGIYPTSNYYIDTNQTILALNSKNNDFSNYTELHLPEEVNAENAQTTDIKVGDWYLLDEPCLKCELSDRMMVEPFMIDKVSVPFDSGIAIVKFADGVQCDLYKYKDKFHKVDPPTKEVELVGGEVYNVYNNIAIFRKQEPYTLHTISIYRKDGTLCTDETNGYGIYTKAEWITATPEQRKQLFDALEKAGKHFDKENMRLLDVEEWSGKIGEAFIYMTLDGLWEAAIFDDKSNYNNAPFYFIPYNDQTKHLIGTTNSPDKHYKFVEIF